MALPFRELPDPVGADTLNGAIDPMGGIGDPEIAADLAAARAAGLLQTPDDAWGNAAIPGFGIGQPVTAPELDPAAQALPLGSAEDAARAKATFDIDPDQLVLTTTPDVRLIVAAGSPTEAVGRNEQRFLLGLLGATLAIGSAVALRSR